MKTFVAVIALLASTRAVACPEVVATGAWIREAPPGAMSVAYVTLANRGARERVLDGARSEAFGGAGLHQTTIDASGMARMREGTLAIAAGATAVLEPGGWHLMLFDPATLLKAGDVVPVTLTCGKDELAVPFTVKASP